MTENEKERYVEETRWVVNDVISKYTHLMDRDELEGAGLLGLIEGIEKYKTGKGTKMSTYVRHWVRARVMAAVYENRLVHIPWNKINNYIKAQRDNPDAVGISGYNTAVNYTPNGVKSFEDGGPTTITMTLTFKETELLTKDLIAEGY